MATEKRLIDANALDKAIKTDFWEHFTQCHDTDQVALIDMVCEDIGNAPTVDAVEVVHGKWKPVKYNAHCSCGKSYGTYHYLCTACNRISYAQPYGLNYCPNCGAKMDGDGNG